MDLQLLVSLSQALHVHNDLSFISLHLPQLFFEKSVLLLLLSQPAPALFEFLAEKFVFFADLEELVL